MAVVACGHPGVTAVLPGDILGGHHMAIHAGFRRFAQIRRRAGNVNDKQTQPRRYADHQKARQSQPRCYESQSDDVCEKSSESEHNLSWQWSGIS